MTDGTLDRPKFTIDSTTMNSGGARTLLFFAFGGNALGVGFG